VGVMCSEFIVQQRGRITGWEENEWREKAAGAGRRWTKGRGTNAHKGSNQRTTNLKDQTASQKLVSDSIFSTVSYMWL